MSYLGALLQGHVVIRTKYGKQTYGNTWFLALIVGSDYYPPSLVVA